MQLPLVLQAAKGQALGYLSLLVAVFCWLLAPVSPSAQMERSIVSSALSAQGPCPLHSP